MDIAIVHPYLNYFGGAEQVIAAIVNSIPVKINVCLYSFDFGKIFTEKLNRTVKFHYLPSNWFIESKKLPITKYWTLRALLNAFLYKPEEVDADIINYHNIPAFFLIKPLYQDVREVWMCQEPLASDFLIQNLSNPELFSLPLKIFVNFYRIFEKRRINSLSDIFVNSSKIKTFLHQTYGINAKILPMPIKESFYNEKEKDFEKERNSILIINGTERRKGFFDFTFSSDIKSLLKREQAKIYCEGEIYDDKFLFRIKNYLGKELHLIGRAKRINEFYKRTEFVLITNYNEPFGLSAIEGLCFGAIPIVPKSSGVARLIEKYKCGISFSSRADFVRKFRTLHDQKRMEFRNNGKLLLDSLSPENFKKAVMEMFKIY